MCVKFPRHPLWAHAGSVGYSQRHEIDGGQSAAVRPAQQSEQCGQGSAGNWRARWLGRCAGSASGLPTSLGVLGSANRRSGTDTGIVPSVPEPEIATISAALLPSHWTRGQAADFMSELDPAAKPMTLYGWRADTAGIHRRAFCRRAGPTSAELRSLLMRMSHERRRSQRERGMTMPRPVVANSSLQSYFVYHDFAAVAGPTCSAR